MTGSEVESIKFYDVAKAFLRAVAPAANYGLSIGLVWLGLFQLLVKADTYLKLRHTEC
jgi:hypothetical protein